MGFFDKLKQKAEQQQATARERYYACIARIDLNDPTEDDAAELESLLGDLHIRHEKAQADHAEVQKALGELAIAPTLHATTKTYNESELAYLAACKERQETHHEQNSKVTAAIVARDTASAEKDRAMNATHYVRELDKADPLLARVLREHVAKASGKKQAKAK